MEVKTILKVGVLTVNIKQSFNGEGIYPLKIDAEKRR